MTDFTQTMREIFGEYRTLLKRYHTREERAEKILTLRLNSRMSSNELSMYETADAIVADIDEKIKGMPRGYYSYSGLENFREYLANILGQYTVEGSRVLHRTQKASCSMIKAFQYIAMPSEKLSDQILMRLFSCNHDIANFGTADQCKQYEETLRKHMSRSEPFFRKVLDNFLGDIYSRRQHDRAVNAD